MKMRRLWMTHRSRRWSRRGRMDGIDGQNPVKIGFPNINLFKCKNLSSACPRCPSLQGGHSSPCPPRYPCSRALPKIFTYCLLLQSQVRVCLWNPAGTTSLSTRHSLCPHGFACLVLRLRDGPYPPSSPQPGCSANTKHSQVSDVFWMLHKGSP